MFLVQMRIPEGVLNETELMEVRWGRLVSNASYFPDVQLPTKLPLYASARVVCGPHGAGFANLAFCAPGASVVGTRARGISNAIFRGFSHRGTGLRHAVVICRNHRAGDRGLEQRTRHGCGRQSRDRCGGGPTRYRLVACRLSISFTRSRTPIAGFLCWTGSPRAVARRIPLADLRGRVGRRGCFSTSAPVWIALA